MKKIYLLLLFSFCFLLFAITVKAAVSAPSPANDVLGQQTINELKNRIASKVAQLKLVEKRGVIGTVTDVSDTQVTISDLHDNTRFIDIDEFTKFSSPSAKLTFGISDIKKGTTIGVLGLYNKESQRILARFINVLDIPKYMYGVVRSIDKKNFTFILTNKDRRQTVVNVENTTRTSSYSKGEKLKPSGFSKIVENESVIVVGFTDSQNKDSIISTRIILLPDISSFPSGSPSATIIPSAGSSKK